MDRPRASSSGLRPVSGGEALDRYEPGLDGLRGCAVAIVLAYHSDMSWAKGGFLGISLFFTLSGFLITSILLRMHERTGSVRLRTFWGRRYRRLLPAAYLTLAGIVVFGATVATRQQLSDLPGAVTSAIFQVSNWFFMFAGQSYVNLFSAPSPVQHFWSLSIEEQFYVVMPIVLIVLLRRTRSMRTLAAIFAGAAAASTLLMIVLYQHGASLDRLYYGTDTRAAEILVGCTAAVVLHRRPLQPLGLAGRRAWAAAGAGAFVAMIVGWNRIDLTSPMLWRGGFLLFALLALVVIISVLHHSGPVASVVQTRPFAAVGRVSYGLYVFHWPIYLWLDEQRTGLSPWPLLALRVTVTAIVTALSYHLLEMPIRDRKFHFTPTQVRSIALASITAIIVGSVAVANRNVASNVAGLDAPVPSAQQVLAGQRPMKVLVIPQSSDSPTMKSLLAYAAKNRDVELTVAPPLTCSGVTRVNGAELCTNWLEDWPSLIKRVDPDVVLFQVTQWNTNATQKLAPAKSPTVQQQMLQASLSAGFNLLRARGAPIMWSPDQLDARTLLVAGPGPFYEAMDTLTVSSTVLRSEDTSTDPAPLVDQLRAVRRRSSGQLTRVLVVGDSVSRSLGYGLEQWATATNSAVVLSIGAGGCGIADDGNVIDNGRATPTPARCRQVEQGWDSQVQQFKPDLVIVLSSIWDNQQRQLSSWPKMLVPGDPAFDDYLVKKYTDAYDALSAHGAKVLWMKSPCAHPGLGPWPTDKEGNPWATSRIQHVNNVVLGRVAKARPGIRFFDLFSIVCPDGKVQNEVGGVQNFRPDGMHFSPDASIWLADNYGKQMLAAGLR
jgi:peptidoglycan/LPS O-acetylase OafA/YrhL